jgi:hypothetical protein
MPFDLPSEQQNIDLHLGKTPSGPDVANTLPTGYSGETFGTPTVPSTYQPETLKAPALYYPGKDAATYQAPFSISNVFEALGGAVMTNLQMPAVKLRIAQQEIQLRESQDQQAWQNLYRANAVAEQNMRVQNQNMMEHGIEMSARAKDDIYNAPPEKKELVTTFWKKYLDSAAPGFGDVATFFRANQGHTYLFDAFLQSGTSEATATQELVAQNGYPQTLQQDTTKVQMQIYGHDLLQQSIGNLDDKHMKMLQEGKLTQEELLIQIPGIALRKNWSPVEMRAAQATIMDPNFENGIAGLGVITNIAKATLQKKPGTGNPMNAVKAAEFTRNQFKIDHATELDLSQNEIDKLQNRNDILEQIERPLGNPGQSRSDVRANTLSDLSSGQYQTDADITNKTKPGSPERLQARAWAKQATEAKKTASAQASLGARMQEPAPLEKLTNTFSAKALFKDHVLEGVGPQSTLTLRTNTDNFTASPDEQVKYSNIIKSKAAGKSLFDMASRVFTATSSAGLTMQTAKMGALNSQLTAPFVTVTNPELATYHDILEAWAGNNAKALGGEVGVLTNVDIDRWVRTFPKGGDTPAVIKMKHKIFDQMTDLVRNTQEGILAGRLKPIRDENGYITDKAIRQKIEGLLGSAEGLTKSESKTEQPADRGQSLLERMQSGK